MLDRANPNANQFRPARRPRTERGAALLIAIFALLLISVVGIALLVSTGTDSALAGNYRTSTGAYYAALAGLEEARGRLLWKNPDFLNKSAPGFVPSQGGPALGASQVLYIINPANGESVVPTDLSNAATYPDTEYGTEFPGGFGSATVLPYVNSTSAMAGLPGPMFKWARITAVTERSSNLDVDNDGTATNSTTPLFYDGSGLNLNQSGGQALEITALAVLPSGARKMLQYVVSPNSTNLSFPSALTLSGNNVSYSGPASSAFYINGIDPAAGRTCSLPALPPEPAIGYTNSSDASATNVIAGTTLRPANYVGSAPPPPAPPTPSVSQVVVASNLQKPSQVESLIQNIMQGADVVIAGPADRTSLPTTMSASNPMTIVVNGDLDLNGWRDTGYGLLLVTGSLNYDPDATWKGIVLVLGKGTFTASRAGTGHIEGAMLVTQSRDTLGNVLPDPNLGAPSVVYDPTTGGTGIYFNSCWTALAQMPRSYKVLAFREIPLTN